MKKLLLILLCFPMIGFGQPTVNIPDANFKAYLVGNTAINTNGDTEIQQSEAVVFNGTIDCPFMNISDLTGIEYFTALTTLNCNDNQFTTLDVSGATTLTNLRCQGNQLTTLDVNNNTTLTHLYCGYNNLDTLDVSNNTLLTNLDCGYNNLDTLDVSNNTLLTNLSCGGNYLTILDVSANTALIWLHCSYNNLNILDVSNNINLLWLMCHENHLTSLDVRNGNNMNMSSANNFTSNYNLYCISVDDVAWADTNWTVANGNIDSTMFFSANCATALGCTDSLACNYDALATIYDSSCFYSWSGIYVNISSVCDSLIIGNMVFHSIGAGVYADTIPISNGCDSIVIYTFDINQSTSSYDTLSANSAFVWNGNTLNLSGDYSDTLINSVGCDSIANLNLTITNTTGLLDVTNTEKTLLKITDILGQETPYRKNTPLFYIYDDGTVERKLFLY